MKKLAVFLFVVVYAKHSKYKGWSSFFVQPSTEDQLISLVSVSEQHTLDFWAYPTLHREGIAIVKPVHQDGFLKTLEDLGITYSSHVADMKAQLDYEDFFIEENNYNASRAGNIQKKSFHDKYQNIESINKYMVDMSKRYPKKVKLIIPAKSFEGRPVHYLKISNTNFQNKSKPVIFIDGGIHAREWISPPTVTWAIHKLVENVTEPDLLKRFDWILLPVVNPDGYEYSITTDPMWRKTRSINHPEGDKCPGADGNRNFDISWGEVHTSKYPCLDNYGGSKPFSEIEIRIVRDILQEHHKRIAMYISMHSTGSLILYPWGNNGSDSYNADNLILVSRSMAKEIDNHALTYFLRYRVGNPASVVYMASGASQDYAHSIGIPLAFTIELPGYTEGFHLRPSYIPQICRETWEGFVVGARMAGDMFISKSKKHGGKYKKHGG